MSPARRSITVALALLAATPALAEDFTAQLNVRENSCWRMRQISTLKYPANSGGRAITLRQRSLDGPGIFPHLKHFAIGPYFLAVPYEAGWAKPVMYDASQGDAFWTHREPLRSDEHELLQKLASAPIDARLRTTGFLQDGSIAIDLRYSSPTFRESGWIESGGDSVEFRLRVSVDTCDGREIGRPLSADAPLFEIIAQLHDTRFTHFKTCRFKVSGVSLGTSLRPFYAQRILNQNLAEQKREFGVSVGDWQTREGNLLPELTPPVLAFNERAASGDEVSLQLSAGGDLLLGTAYFDPCQVTENSMPQIRQSNRFRADSASLLSPPETARFLERAARYLEILKNYGSKLELVQGQSEEVRRETARQYLDENRDALIEGGTLLKDTSQLPFLDQLSIQVSHRLLLAQLHALEAAIPGDFALDSILKGIRK